MKTNTLKRITIILLIVLISLLSFVGIYSKDLNRLKNIMPEYKMGMDFGEIRVARLDISQETETKYYDEEGNEVSAPSEETEATEEQAEEQESKNITSKEVKINPDEVLTSENFAKVKDIMTKRLNNLGVYEYQLRQDENGYISVELFENNNAGIYLQGLTQVGKFEVRDNDTDELLLNNDQIKEAFLTTHADNSGAITILLIVNLDEEGKAKLLEMSKTYVQTTDDEGNTTTKSIKINIDGQTVMRTYFDREFTSGQLPVSIGEASTDTETINKYYKQAALIVSTIKFGMLPITYNVTYENILSSVIRPEVIQVLSIAIAIVIVIAIAYLIIRYNNGIFMGISWFGFFALYLLVLRFTNSIISMNCIIGIIIVCVYNYLFLNSILRNKQNKKFNDIWKKYCIIGIPMYIIAIVFTFASMIPVSSFGAALFWGNALMIAYNYVITKNLYIEK